MRKRRAWKLRTHELQLGERTLLIGILNITPDSFSDGGKYLDPDRAFTHALELEQAGADIIDIGAESTRPGSARIGEAEELRRLVPVLKRLRGKIGIPISVDTYKAGVADRAFEHGAEIVNDPFNLTFDPNLAKIVSANNAGFILNHMRGAPETWARMGPMVDPVGTVYRELEAGVSRAVRAGVDRSKIVVDPGLGFGKRREQSFELLAKIESLRGLDLPVMVGASRKSFLNVPEQPVSDYATAAAVTAAILGGADMVRVHDVAAMKIVAQAADSIYAARQQ